jgi:hypothetical protein
LTIYRVSVRSAELFGKSSPYFIPQGLYFQITKNAFIPTIQQLIALSKISNICLVDWLAVFGFRLDDIPRLQLLMTRRRTVLLDSSVYDPEAWIPWFAERQNPPPQSSIVPLGQLLAPQSPRRIKNLSADDPRKFRYAKVGQQDPYAFPTLGPGSIVRVNELRTADCLRSIGEGISENVFLVKYGSSFHCGHLTWPGRERVLLCSAAFPFAQMELVRGRNVRILGVVDAEIRRLSSGAETKTSIDPLHTADKDTASLPRNRAQLQQFIRSARATAGLSFREASSMSRDIALNLSDDAYFAAPGTLSDYENQTSPLRHIQKLISLCILYSVDFWSLLRAGGLPVDSLGTVAIHDEFVDRTGFIRPSQLFNTSAPRADSQASRSTCLNEWGELPVFTRNALSGLTGLKSVSMSDIYWVGRNQTPTHPHLAGARLLFVNRRVKTPQRLVAGTASEQPLYMILQRDGTYLCATVELRDGLLKIHKHPAQPHTFLHLKNGIDAEIIGMVTAIVRRLS